GVLPYQSPDTAQIVFDSVDTSDPGNPVVKVTVTSSRVDVKRVELFVYDDLYAPVPQPGNTPDARGYNVYPSWFDMDEWNRQYSHKDSTNFPWESYGAGGENECPFYLDHGPSYSAHVHLDAADPADFQVGLFNGLRIQTLDYTPGNYALTLTFNELQGPAQCILAKVELAAGGAATQSWGDCSGVLPMADDQSVETEVNLPVDITLTGTGTNLTYEITRWPLDGLLTGTPPDVTYSPDLDFTGIDSFDFVVDDGFATSNVATVTVTVNDTADPGVPADPASVTAANADPADGTAVVGWTHDGANVTAFEIRREKQNKRGAWRSLATVATVPAGSTSHVDPSGDGTFRYQVRALNGSQSSNWMPAQWAEVAVTTASGGGGGGGGDGSINCSKKQNRDLPECNGG
ncbi:MAG TPA: Ig-like domain-containing protein, partial [Thermohalobaculum sp.]|nr:Ig-like domain-containing protein [Thermohalobaculum sp.]